MLVEMPRLGQNGNPSLSKAGKRRKNARDGNTNQKIDRERLAMAWVSDFSLCIQMIARREVRGSDAMRAPKSELCLATSLTMMMIIAEIPTLIR